MNAPQKKPISSKDTIKNPLARCRAVILAGGSGTRLWPLSRALLPKQLLALNGTSTLLQQTVIRTLEAFPPEHIVVVTNEEHVFEVRSQLAAVDERLEEQVLAEPMGRNTLPATLLGLSGVAGEKAGEEAGDETGALLAVFPSDHLIHDSAKWAESLRRGTELAAEGWFVTFGVRPDHAETGYGYIARGKELGNGAYEVRGFVEKPDLERAGEFVRSGEYYWNSGMFVFGAADLLAAVEEFQPVLAEWWHGRSEQSLAKGYGKLPDISIDYGIMERAARIAVVDANFGWDDLGSWEAMYRLGQKDEEGCVVQGDVLAVDCKNSLLLSKGGKLAAVGLEEIIAIQTRDATLLCRQDQVQKVKTVVELLKAQGSPLVETHLTVRRPWGSYTVLEEGPRYKIKRINVLPGAKLSLQMHHHRAEHWVVITGTADIRLGDEDMILVENQSVDIPQATPHRLANPGKVPLEIIEIQSGPYLEEDDIVRFDDAYGRSVE